MKVDRGSERIKRRVTCELVLDGRRYRGIVLDLSETGVFVQTEATPAPGASLRLRFHGVDGTAFEVEASVARRQVAPPQLASVVRGGLGLRVTAPPPAYFELLGQSAEQATTSSEGRAAAERRKQAGPSAAPKAGEPKAGAATPARPPDAVRARPALRPAPAPTTARPPPAGDPFRVRVKQSDGPRSRTVEVRASSASDAAKRVLADVGRGWEVLKVERG